MATPVIGQGPVEFTDLDAGTQVSIPLTSLYFDGQGKIQADTWALWAGYNAAQQTGLTKWLTYLVKNGVLKPGKGVAPVAALVIKATSTGNLGNGIQVKFDNFVPDPAHPNDPTFDITITKTETHELLTVLPHLANFIMTILGTEVAAPAEPGLAVVDSTTAAFNLPVVGSTDLAVDGTATAVLVPAGADAFTLISRWRGVGATLKADISNVDNDAQKKSFTLTLTWKRVVAGVKVSNVNFAVGASGPDVTFSAPQGAPLAAPPLDTSVTLNGGDNPKPASQAAVTVYKSA